MGADPGVVGEKTGHGAIVSNLDIARDARYSAFLAVLDSLDVWAAEECLVANEILLIRVRQLMAIGRAWSEATQ